MTFDAHKNFAISTVLIAPSPALTGPGLTVAAGEGSLFPATPFNAVVFPANASPLAGNAEVVRVTGRSGDALTIARAQEGSSARSIQAGDRIMNAITAKALTDIEAALTASRATPAYSASITPDASLGRWQTIVVTNGSAFTVNAPTNPPDASHTAELAIEISNASGGAMGAITWNGAFVLVGGAFTNPANGKKRLVRFEWNGSAWVETSRSGADY